MKMIRTFTVIVMFIISIRLFSGHMWEFQSPHQSVLSLDTDVNTKEFGIVLEAEFVNSF